MVHRHDTTDIRHYQERVMRNARGAMVTIWKKGRRVRAQSESIPKQRTHLRPCEPHRSCSLGQDANSRARLQRELGPAVVVFSHTGPHLGQLLPCGEIIGFLEFSPLAQHYDLCYLASIKPKAEHAGVYYTWQQIHKSAGIKSPSDQDCWFEKIITSGVESKDITFRAIKTFRELGEKIWQVPSAQSFTETLNLLLKEMDYTVLLLLGHCHQDDQGIWSNRLQVLFERLDPALWPKNQLASSANASAPNAEEFHAETQSWQLPSDLAAEMQESQEPATFSNAWSNPTPCSTPEPVDEGIYAVSEGLMDLRF